MSAAPISARPTRRRRGRRPPKPPWERWSPPRREPREPRRHPAQAAGPQRPRAPRRGGAAREGIRRLARHHLGRVRGAHALGARSLGIYRDALEDEVAYLLAFCGAKAVLAEDEEQVDKLLNISERVPTLRHIIYSDPRGMRKYSDPRLLPASELVKRGEAAHKDQPACWGQ